MRVLNFGIVGAGNIAQVYGEVLLRLDGVRITGIADVHQNAAQTLSATLGCPAFSSYQAMGFEANLDAVIICTPPVTHAPIAQYFAACGVHVLCEKPLSIDVPSAKSMLRCAAENGTILTMASKFRFVDDMIFARKLIASGNLGEVVQIENTFTSYVDMSQRWNSIRTFSGGGVLMDNGTHASDIFRFLMGTLLQVHAVEATRVQRLQVEDTASFTVRAASGALGTSDLSWTIQKPVDTFIRIYGTDGTLFVGWKDSRLLPKGSADWSSVGKGYDKAQAFKGQLVNFVSAIHGQEEIQVTPAEGLASVEAIDAVYASIRFNRWAFVRATSIPEAQAVERRNPLLLTA